MVVVVSVDPIALINVAVPGVLKFTVELDVSITSKPSTLIFCASIDPSVCVLTIFPACPVVVKSPPVFTISAKLIAVIGPNAELSLSFLPSTC